MEKNKYTRIIGHNIRLNRQQKCISQEKLADITGLHRTYIGSVERGERNISIINLVKIAFSLDIKPSQLLEGIEKDVTISGC
ncbi:TPA: helix-turn-helix transcriptional regulator [Vibrio parahaemolyticus]|nr:helix-turn-helix transcriptional regulator [Vibrio parahaemolyticus]